MPDKNQRQRLKALVGHDMIVNLLHDAHDEEGIPSGIPPGRLREVGDDYLLLETTAVRTARLARIIAGGNHLCSSGLLRL